MGRGNKAPNTLNIKEENKHGYFERFRPNGRA